MPRHQLYCPQCSGSRCECHTHVDVRLQHVGRQAADIERRDALVLRRLQLGHRVHTVHHLIRHRIVHAVVPACGPACQQLSNSTRLQVQAGSTHPCDESGTVTELAATQSGVIDRSRGTPVLDVLVRQRPRRRHLVPVRALGAALALALHEEAAQLRLVPLCGRQRQASA